MESNPPTAGLLVMLESENFSTTELLGQCLVAMNRGDRVQLLTPPGMGTNTLQRLRMRLSRLRNQMDKRGKPKQHFSLSARRFPYTDAKGKRFDCVILEKRHSRQHQIAEMAERFFKHGIAD